MCTAFHSAKTVLQTRLENQLTDLQMRYLFHLLAIVASFALLFAAYGGHVDPTVWTLPSLATLALPVVAIVVLVLLALLLLLKQWRFALIILGALFLSWPVLRLNVPLNLTHNEADSSKHQFKVLTMNVTEFNWQDRTTPNKSMRYILDEEADIVVIQEGLVYFSFEKLPTVKPMLDELYHKYPYRMKPYYDVGIMSKYPFVEVQSPALAQDSLSYFIKAWDVEMPDGKNLRVVSMHLSSLRFNSNETSVLETIDNPSGRKARLQAVSRKLDDGFQTHARQARAMRQLIDETTGDLLVMGDMNDTPGSFAYRTVCGDDLRDAWAEAGFGPIHTFHDHHMFVKIDHILYRGDMTVLSCRCDKAGESDHYPMVATLER